MGTDSTSHKIYAGSKKTLLQKPVCMLLKMESIYIKFVLKVTGFLNIFSPLQTMFADLLIYP